MGNRVVMIKSIVFVISVFISNLIFGMSGKVIDSHTKESLPFVNVYVVNKKVGTITDFDGSFSIEVTKGDTIKFSFISYSEKILIVEDNWDGLVELETSNFELEEITIKAIRNIGSENSTIHDKINADEVVSIVGKEEIERKGIQSTQQVVNKIVGVNYNDDDITVRGLTDRYNQTTLNFLPVPSSDPDRKNLDIDLIPKSIVANVEVTKTYSPNFFSEATGAQINVNTNKILKDEISLKSSISNSNGINHSHQFSLSRKNNILNFYGYIKWGESLSNTVGNIKNINKQGNISLNYNVDRREEGDNLNGFIFLNKDLDKCIIDFISLVNFNKNTSSIITNGNHFDYNKDISTLRNTPTTNILNTNQLNFKFPLEKGNIYFLNSYSFLTNQENNREQYVWFEDMSLNTIDINDNHRFSSHFTEHNFAHKFFIDKKYKNYQTILGLDFYNSIREFDYERYYFQFHTTSSIDVESLSSYVDEEIFIHDPAANVTGNLMVGAFYLKQKVEIKNWVFNGGARGELVSQNISHLDQMQPIFTRQYGETKFYLLPYMSSKVKIKNHQLRFNFSQTLSQPRFRELTPFEYTEMFASAKIKGNPELVTSTINNVDLRVESKKNIMYSVGIFYKLLNNPIERINLATASGQLQSFQNSNQAYVYGLEIEVKKKWKNLCIDGNLIYMNSNIILNDEDEASLILTNLERPLQGSTPFIFNTDISYGLKDINFSTTYNYNHKTLFAAGIQGLGDIYQKPQHTLNLTIDYTYKKHKFTIFGNNILSTPFILEQSHDYGIEKVREIENPLIVGVSYKIIF